jgi:RNA polymerase sigma-70 factor (ECF subfamily)
MQPPSPRPDDLQATDPQTWLDAYGDYLYRYALLRVRDESLAEDLVQEILLAALKGRAGFNGRSSERTWLTGILKHKIVDQLPVTQKGDTSMLNCQETSRLIPKTWIGL